MRSEQEMLQLIVATAQTDDRIRAVIMNGSRANPNVPQDSFQDYDIVYLVTDVSSFRAEPEWINRFGERMIMQLPDDMFDSPPNTDGSFAYLMQFADGNRIDLTVYPLARLAALGQDSLSVLLLDKDGIIGSLAPASDRDYLPQPPTAKAYADCCNEFWWVCPYVAKGLWREEITYAKSLMDQAVRDQLMKMLTWYVGVKTQFSRSPGKLGKYLKHDLEPKLWEMLLKTYADADYANTWTALFTMGDLFRLTASSVAEQFSFEYPRDDDKRVTAHLRRVRSLPKNAREMY